jgi:site-specific DNA-methyltransferase (adenine-specific)
MTPVILSERPLIRAFNCDCMSLMAETPDKHYSLCITDPPYGVGADDKNNGSTSACHARTSLAKLNTYKTGWDNAPPKEDYFNELFRISKNQIIWGANYFGLKGGYIFWDKGVTMPTYSDGELAYCSLINSIKKVSILWHGMLQQDMQNKEQRIHSTQKPVALYLWLLTNYAKPSQTILDTHGGSFSSAIACWKMGFDLDICEIDEDYFNEAVERFDRETRQLKLFGG